MKLTIRTAIMILLIDRKCLDSFRFAFRCPGGPVLSGHPSGRPGGCPGGSLDLDSFRFCLHDPGGHLLDFVMPSRLHRIRHRAFLFLFATVVIHHTLSFFISFPPPFPFLLSSATVSIGSGLLVLIVGWTPLCFAC